MTSKGSDHGTVSGVGGGRVADGVQKIFCSFRSGEHAPTIFSSRVYGNLSKFGFENHLIPPFFTPNTTILVTPSLYVSHVKSPGKSSLEISLPVMVMLGRETIKNIKETPNKSPGVVSRPFWAFKNLGTDGGRGVG